MGTILGIKDHIGGTSSGDAPGSNSKSRIGQGLAVPKTPRQANPPKTVSGTHSYGIRHAIVQQAPDVTPGASVDKLPKIYKTPKLPTP